MGEKVSLYKTSMHTVKIKEQIFLLSVPILHIPKTFEAITSCLLNVNLKPAAD